MPTLRPDQAQQTVYLEGYPHLSRLGSRASWSLAQVPSIPMSFGGSAVRISSCHRIQVALSLQDKTWSDDMHTQICVHAHSAIVMVGYGFHCLLVASCLPRWCGRMRYYGPNVDKDLRGPRSRKTMEDMVDSMRSRSRRLCSIFLVYSDQHTATDLAADRLQASRRVQEVKLLRT